jgi:hypothetical protein
MIQLLRSSYEKKKQPKTTSISARTAKKKWRKVAAASTKSADEAWKRLIKMGEELGKGWQSEKSAVEILSEMRR